MARAKNLKKGEKGTNPSTPKKANIPSRLQMSKTTTQENTKEKKI